MFQCYRIYDEWIGRNFCHHPVTAILSQKISFLQQHDALDTAVFGQCRKKRLSREPAPILICRGNAAKTPLTRGHHIDDLAIPDDAASA
jgi:hypothetical protein